MTKWSEAPGPGQDPARARSPQVPPPPGQDRPAWQVPPPPAPIGGQLHPAAIAVWSAGQVGASILLFLLNPALLLLAIPLVAVVVATSAVRYARFRWRLEDGALVIEQGLVQRRRRVIPLERIQSVDLVRRISHRLLGVVAVQVEAIGSRDTEGKLDALSPEIAARLRALLLAGRARVAAPASPAAAAPTAAPAGAAAAAPAPDAGGEVLARLGPRELLLAGLTEVNTTLLVAAGGLVWELLGDRVGDVVQRAPTLLARGGALVALAGVLAVALALLVGAQFVLYWNFQLRREGAELQVRRGLIEERFDTIPLRRLQALRLEENLPRRLLGFAAVKADVAGKPGGGARGADTILPFGRVGDAHALVARILEQEQAQHVRLRPMPARARSRRQVRAGVLTAALTTVAVALWGAAGLAALGVALPALAAAEASYRALGHAELDRLVVTRAGWWVRRTAFVPHARLQTMALEATALQRLRRLATLELHIARSPGLWQGPQMIDLDRDDARAVVGALAPAAAARRGRAG